MYLYLSVSFIQMLKSVAPIAVLLISWAWGVAEPSLYKFLNILVIVIGVAVSSFGEIEFSWIGFAFQLGGTIFEAMRLVMIQVMLTKEHFEMDPLVGLYYYTPVCMVINLLIVAVTEAPKFKWDDLANVGFGILFLNALVAFMLNISSVLLVRQIRTSTNSTHIHYELLHELKLCRLGKRLALLWPCQAFLKVLFS